MRGLQMHPDLYACNECLNPINYNGYHSLKDFDLFLLVVFLPKWAPSEPGGGELSLERLLGMARNTHPEIQGRALSPQIAQETQNGLVGTQDWNLSVSGESYYEKPLPSPVPGTPDSDLQFGLAAELTKANWNSGSRITLGASSGYRDSSFIFDSFSQFQNRIFAEYSVSLMRNARGILDRLAFDLAAYDIDIVQIESEENQEGFLLELGSLFLDWALLKEQVRILDARLGIAREELERTKRMRKDNLVEQVDVLRAEDSVTPSQPDPSSRICTASCHQGPTGDPHGGPVPYCRWLRNTTFTRSTRSFPMN